MVEDAPGHGGASTSVRRPGLGCAPMSDQPPPAGTTTATPPPCVAPLGDGEVDLLGVVADGELSAFLRLAAQARTGPTLSDVEGLADIAVGHLHRYRAVRDHLSGRGVSPESAMEPFRAGGEAFHRRLAPSTWTEALLGAYVGDGIATDFLVAVASHAEPDVAALVARELGPPPGPDDGNGGAHARDEALATFVVACVGRATASDAQLRSRLSLWGRRLVGEALGQAQALLVARPALEGLLAGPRQRGPGAPMPVRAPIAEVFSLITAAHVARMARLGLTA